MDPSLADNSRFKKLSKRLGHSFKQPQWLLLAFQHASYVNEQADPNLESNERLEFLGDAVLDLAISHILMELFQAAPEGRLSKFRAMVVDETALCRVAQNLKLGDYLLLGKGEEQSHGREKTSILADTTEALLGALYLDAGFPKTMRIIRTLFSPLLEMLGKPDVLGDFKSLLQEYTQQTFKTLPKYQLMEESGPPHDKSFKVALTLNGDVLAKGKGKSKKEAEQKAAKEAFSCLRRS